MSKSRTCLLLSFRPSPSTPYTGTTQNLGSGLCGFRSRTTLPILLGQKRYRELQISKAVIMGLCLLRASISGWPIRRSDAPPGSSRRAHQARPSDHRRCLSRAASRRSASSVPGDEKVYRDHFRNYTATVQSAQGDRVGRRTGPFFSTWSNASISPSSRSRRVTGHAVGALVDRRIRAGLAPCLPYHLHLLGNPGEVLGSRSKSATSEIVLFPPGG